MTSPPITTERQRELIASISRLVARRAKDEVEIRERDRERVASAQAEYERERTRAAAAFERDHARLVAGYKEAREAAYFQCETQGCTIAVEQERFDEEASQKHTEYLEDARNVWQMRGKQLEEDFSASESMLKNDDTHFQHQCQGLAVQCQTFVREAEGFLRGRGTWLEVVPPPLPLPQKLARHIYIDRHAAALARARELFRASQNQPADRFIEDGWPLLIFVFGLFLAGYPCYLAFIQFGWPAVIGATLAIPLVVALVVRQLVRPIAKRQILQIVPELMQAIVQTQAELAAAVQAAEHDSRRTKRRAIKRRDRAVASAQIEWERTQQEQTISHQTRLGEADVKFMSRRKIIEETHDHLLREVESRYPPEITRIEREFERRMSELAETFARKRAANRQQYEGEWNDLVTQWSAGLTEFQAEVAAMNDYCQAHFPSWESIDWETWQPPVAGKTSDQNGDGAPPRTEDISALRFGQYVLNLETLAGGLPRDADLAMPQARFDLPAVLSYPERPSLLIEAEGDGRDAATRLIQDVMLRLATTFPPGKVRFTIIDPVGLGQNFSAFMHLADYDERLVASRIWTESAHVNQRLVDLTEHMENVIQKYLRNEFASIQEYNRQAGEVAEPFQILVVANFPASFSDEAARRLVSIAASGARCGVYTLISTDTRLKLPRNFDLADLQSQAATLVWEVEQSRFAWKHDDLRHLPLAVEEPPDDERFTAIVRTVGKYAKDAARVEVPFEAVVPPESEWWAGDSRGEVQVPLGRAGAKKLQFMRLGKGTSQHVLISGKTGSGKSTLLNAMITNLAIHYSPEELQFYLIDFKKGVEFKAYAAQKLPHARVIAIESEREFGMSVLERLDQELKRRGDLFRQFGVQDLKGYRTADPTAVMPRVLLVIDEFQEFFTSDDKISHDAGLLLDRLVRQGRAFGIHVLLGSQTLAGAYSLARSTIGQMAVRIALQCSESDAHLILSADNTAARLLSRPGEAIYNDANGLLEGNHPFQVVWLSDEQREHYLQQVARLADDRHLQLPTAIVFEGNVAADPATNDLLRDALQQPPPAERAHVLRAWLGSAVAIKDPTQAAFRRQGGSNLLIVGQQEELALGILASSLIALAAHVRGSNAGEGLNRFYIFDGTRPESPEAGFWRRITGQMPLDAKIVTTRDTPQVVAKIAAEVDRRLAAGDASGEPIFLFIYNLARFRDLRKSDDFSFDDGDSAAAGKQLVTIFREGPALGVHTIVWADSFSNASRWLDRQTLRDLEMRVLFQMSATDSSNLMDSPAASKLGIHAALFYSEEQGQAEKFRPYGLPSAEWLAWVAERLAARTTAPA